MISFRRTLLPLAITSALGCGAEPAAPTGVVPPIATPRPAMSAVVSSPPPAREIPPPVDLTAAHDAAAAALKERVEQLPEVRWLGTHSSGGLSTEATFDAAKDSAACEVSVTGEVWYRFRSEQPGDLVVSGAGGASAEEPYESFHARESKRQADLEITDQKLAARLAALPEVKRFRARSRAGGANPVSWLESPPPPVCDAQRLTCDFVYYVGEIMVDHANRWATFYMDPSGPIHVTSLDIFEPTPLAKARAKLR